MGAVVVAGLLTGCGGGNDDDAAPPAGGLAEPLRAECGTAGFGKPTTEPRENEGSTEWRVTYRAEAEQGEQADPRATTTVLVIERAPEGPRGEVEAGHEVEVDGRPVSLVSQGGGFVAQWKTESARYVALANGASAKTLKRFIACLP